MQINFIVGKNSFRRKVQIFFMFIKNVFLKNMCPLINLLGIYVSSNSKFYNG